MKIKCSSCGHLESVNLDFFVKILGGATAGFGFWAWTSFLFAGTGFAMVICIAIITGGAAMLAYKNEIIDWITNKNYACSECGGKKWVAVSPEVEKEINARDTTIASLKKEAEMEKEINARDAKIASLEKEAETLKRKFNQQRKRQ